MLQSILHKNERIHFTVTGCGSDLINNILAPAGISKWLVGIDVPYSCLQTDKQIGYKPDHYCCKETSIEQAMVSYMKARTDIEDVHQKPVPCVGVAVNAVISSNQPHRGKLRCHIAVVCDTGVYHRFVDLMDPIGMHPYPRDHQNREILLHTTEVLGLAAKCNPWDLVPDAEVFALIMKRPVFTRDGRREESILNNGVIYPGSFNPIHAGHMAIVDEFEESEERGDVTFSINTTSPIKGLCSVSSLLNRIALINMEMDNDVVVTQDEDLYIDKIKTGKYRHILMGYDCFERMLDPKYGITAEQIKKALADNDCELYIHCGGGYELPDFEVWRKFKTRAKFAESLKTSWPAIRSSDIRKAWNNE